MKNKLLLTLLTATCLFSSCTKENEVNMPQDKSEGNKVTFFVNTAPVTRTTVNTTNNSTQFVENDKIGIFEISTSITDANNYEYKVLSDGTLEAVDASKTLYYPNDANEEINFYAYYPFNQDATATDKVEFTVANDQSSETLYNANDFMAATTSGKKTNFTDGVSLTFSHKLALVQLTLIGDDASKVTAVTLNNCKPTSTWTFVTDAVTTSGTAQDIKMWKITADANTYWALVPAQTITTGTILFTMTVGETTYTYKPSASDIVFTANKIKKFNIQLGTNGNTIAVSTDIDATGWDDTEAPVTDNGEVVVPEPVNLVQGGDMEGLSTIAAVTNLAGALNASTWTYATNINVTEGIAEVVDDNVQGKALKMNFSKKTGQETNPTWYNKTICGYAANGTANKYQLSFKAKSDANAQGTPQLIVFLINPTGGNNFFIVENGENYQSSMIQSVNKGTWTEYQMTFDLSKTTTASGTGTVTANKITDATDALRSAFCIGFAANTEGVDFYIDDVSLIKVTE